MSPKPVVRPPNASIGRNSPPSDGGWLGPPPAGWNEGEARFAAEDVSVGVCDREVEPYLTRRLEARAAEYATQAVAYVEALGRALELERRPRFELWFLDRGEVHTF